MWDLRDPLNFLNMMFPSLAPPGNVTCYINRVVWVLCVITDAVKNWVN